MILELMLSIYTVSIYRTMLEFHNRIPTEMGVRLVRRIYESNFCEITIKTSKSKL